MAQITAILILIFSIFAIYFVPGLMVQCVLLHFNKRVRVKGRVIHKPLSIKQKVISCVPLYQMIVLRKAFYNGHASYTLPMVIAIPVLIVLRLVTYSLADTSLPLIITAVGMLLALLTHHLLYMITVFDIACMAQVSIPTKILTIFLPYASPYIIKQRLPHMFELYYKESSLKGKINEP